MINLTSRFQLQVDRMREKRNIVTETRFKVPASLVPNP